MPLVSSPHLIDHAIGQVFESFGTTPVERIRNILKVIHERFGNDLLVTTVLRRCGSDAVLKTAYADFSLGQLWAVLDEKEEEERQLLCQRFKVAVTS